MLLALPPPFSTISSPISSIFSISLSLSLFSSPLLLSCFIFSLFSPRLSFCFSPQSYSFSLSSPSTSVFFAFPSLCCNFLLLSPSILQSFVIFFSVHSLTSHFPHLSLIFFSLGLFVSSLLLSFLSYILSLLRLVVYFFPSSFTSLLSLYFLHLPIIIVLFLSIFPPFFSISKLFNFLFDALFRSKHG